MRRFAVLSMILAVMLVFTACDPCPAHDHSGPEISREGLTVSTIDSLGGLLMLEDASWSENDGILTIDVDYGVVDKAATAAVYVDGVEIGTMGDGITFTRTETSSGCSFAFSGMPKGRHVVMIAVFDEDMASSTGSIELEVDIAYSIGIGG